MSKPQTFIFESYGIDRQTGLITLRYAFDNLYHFTETVQLPAPLPPNLPEAELEAALFTLHMIGGVSYYKAFCPPEIAIKSGALTAEAASFWQTVYEKGLGEFSYVNKIDLRGKIQFPVAKDAKAPQLAASGHEPQRVLSLLGGGKDSMASMEILRAASVDHEFMRMYPHPVITNLFQHLGRPYYEVDRKLDGKLIELQQQGAMAGHVPITAYIASVGVIMALIHGLDAVVVSSERTSSYGNVTYLGQEINHQWSKSLEFENLFRDYLRTHVTRRVEYVNPLGSLSELTISKLVAAHPEYLPKITSCNMHWGLFYRPDHESVGLWCGHCPKCAFAFALLAAWLPLDQVVQLFGQNLFDRPANETLYRELFGLEGIKPFECVGTPEEMAVAVYLANQRQPLGQTMVGRMFAEEVQPKLKNLEELVRETLAPNDNLKHQPAYVHEWLRASGVLA
jgi:UDP-N-acetyl-alpha-D-muramoyl-L-alanyl-L-glutamate epimerase